MWFCRKNFLCFSLLKRFAWCVALCSFRRQSILTPCGDSIWVSYVFMKRPKLRLNAMRLMRPFRLPHSNDAQSNSIIWLNFNQSIEFEWKFLFFINNQVSYEKSQQKLRLEWTKNRTKIKNLSDSDQMTHDSNSDSVHFFLFSIRFLFVYLFSSCGAHVNVNDQLFEHRFFLLVFQPVSFHSEALWGKPSQMNFSDFKTSLWISMQFTAN